MKKKILLSCIVILVAATGAFADVDLDGFAIGAAWYGNANFIGGTSFGNDVAVSFKLPSFPPIFAVTLGFNPSWFKFGVIADWWLINSELVDDVLYWYLGPGVIANFAAGTNYGYLNVGVRFPIGLHVYLIDHLEIFAEVAPTLGLGIDTGSSGGIGLTLGFMPGVGARWWF